MKIFDNLDRYLSDLDYKITILNNKVNINNYDEIIDFNDKLIKIRHKNGITIIKGNNLCVCKMIEEEVLIEGDITSISLS